MDKEAKINIGFIAVFVGLLIVLMIYPIVLATHVLPLLNVTIGADISNVSVVEGGRPFGIQINEDTQYVFNFSINHSSPDLASENLTQVNITIPFEFAFLSGSNKSTLNTSANYAGKFNEVFFANISNTNQDHILTWNGTNATSTISQQNASCCNVSDNTYLSFNLSVATPGVYNLSITYRFNNSMVVNSTHINITVNDTNVPTTVKIWPSASGTQPDLNGTFPNASGTITINVTVVDDGNMSMTRGNSLRELTVMFNITNTSGTTGQNLTIFATNVTGVGGTTLHWNATFDTTTVPDGTYNITIWVNDTNDNLNNSKTITNLTIDNSAPTVTASTFKCVGADDNSNVNVGNEVTCTCSPADGLSGVNQTATKIKDSGGIETSTPAVGNTGTFDITCDMGNMAGKTTTATTSYTVKSRGGIAGGGGGGGTAPAFYVSTYPSISKDFSDYKVIVRKLNVKERIQIIYSEVIHHVGVREMTATTVTIEIASSHAVQKEIAIGEEAKADFDDDDIYDISVKLDSIVDGKAFLTLTYIQEVIPVGDLPVEEDEVVEEPAEPVVVEETNLVWLWIIIAIVVVLVAIGWTYKKKR